MWLALIIVACAGALVVLYASLIERNWFALRRHRIPCLPEGSSPMTILHLSDLHLRAPQRRKRAFLKSLARMQPDLLIGTGDFIGDARSNAAAVDAVTAIGARFGALYVLGSNDYYGPKPKNPLRYFLKKRRLIYGTPNPWRELVEGLNARGWRLINNRAMSVDGIDVVGLDDEHLRRADLSVARARSGDGFRLAVAHSPDVAEALADRGYDLIVCGHTHGGQVCLPGFGALVTNSDLPRSMARGVHRLGDSWLHVSAGLGTSMYAPFRLACRPEVCVLELVARER
ncbi:MAG: metallophosphoesterase [Actinobacteria bacterium]|nr:MAG: metallophosphoesterase [Actinomycetota bacterium]TML79863.1 MAG: metallophosphoesterase [Actinomycetota bacterium]